MEDDLITKNDADNQIDNNNVDFDTSQLESEPSNEFLIPDEYKECGWAKNIKTYADLWKCNANAQTLIGRKAIPDFKNASAREITDFFNKLAPANINEYSFDAVGKDGEEHSTFQINDDVKSALGEMFIKNGVPVPMASGLTNAFLNLEAELFTKATDETDLNERIKNVFGDNYQTERKPVEGLMREILSDEDRTLINESMPNTYIEILYKLSKGLIDKYGYKERSSPFKGDGGSVELSKDEKNAKYNETWQKINDLNRRSHKPEERESLIKELENYV